MGIIAKVLDKHCKVKCPIKLHLKQVASLAGYNCLECVPAAEPHLWQLLDGGLVEACVSTGSSLPIGFCLTASSRRWSCCSYLFLADKLTSLFCQALGTILIEDALKAQTSKFQQPNNHG